jgi:hypothetical protein
MYKSILNLIPKLRFAAYLSLFLILLVGRQQSYAQACCGTIAGYTNGGLESGSFATGSNTCASQGVTVTGTSTTFQGSQALQVSLNPGGGSTCPGYPMPSVAVQSGYYVNGASNGGSFSNFYFYQGGCIGYYGAANYIGSFCANTRVQFCHTAAAFNPSQINVAGQTAEIKLEMSTYDGSTPFAVESMTVDGVAVTPSITSSSSGIKIAYIIPASTNVKDINGNPYTGAAGQVIDWGTLNWKNICVTGTLLQPASKYAYFFYTRGGTNSTAGTGVAIDDLSVSELGHPDCGGGPVCTALSSPNISANATTPMATPTTLSATATGTSGSTTYSWSGSGGTFSSTTIANPTWSANTAGTYTLTVTISNGSSCTASATKTIQVVCPTVSAPAVSDASRCGAGTLTATIATTCASGTAMKIFNDAGLTTDISSLFTISGSSVTTNSSQNATSTYYAACLNNTYTQCKSTADAFILTITTAPNVSATATNITCSGNTANSNGKITLSSFTSEKYDYNLGGTYTGSANYGSANAIPSDGVIVSNLANPASSQAYTVRIFNAAGCYTDRTVTLSNVVCACPTVAAPAVADMSRCAAGSLSANITTACASGSSIRVFSNAGLVTDVTSSFTIGGSTLTTTIGATATYYAACQNNTFPACKSLGDDFTLTIANSPTATVAASNVTCSGPTANSNGSITISGFTTEKYDYSVGGTYTGSANYGSATAIPSGGVIVANLPNPASSQAYTVRIFNSFGCYVDRTVTITNTSCACPSVAAPAVANGIRCLAGTMSTTISTACASGNNFKIYSDAGLTADVTTAFSVSGSTLSTNGNVSSTTTYYAACQNVVSPTCKSSGAAFTLTIAPVPNTNAAATNATCSGVTVNSNGKITLSSFTTEKYDYTTGSSYTGSANYGSATTIPAGGVIVSNLPNPSGSQNYTVRIFNASGCYIDRVVTLTVTNCACPSVAAPAVANAIRCSPGTLSTTISTACASGNTFKIFSDAGLTADVTNTFTVVGTALSTNGSIAATTTYYAACQNDVSPICKSTGAAFTLTIASLPSTTATAANVTCTGPTANSNGSITLSSFTTEKYDYTVGATYTGSANYGSAVAIPLGGVIVNNLSNPATTQSYTVRIFGASGCNIDRTVSLSNTTCACPTVAAPAVANASRCAAGAITTSISTACVSGSTIKIFSDAALSNNVTAAFTIIGTVISGNISATTTYYAACQNDVSAACKSTGAAFTLTANAAPSTTANATNPTCAGSTANSNASIVLSGFTTEKYDYTTGGSYTGSANYSSATAIPANGIIANNLPNPASSQSYTVRVFSAAGCYIDRTVSISNVVCVCPAVAAPVVPDATACAAGVFSTTATTNCASGATIKIFSDAGLLNNVSSSFSILGTTITTNNAINSSTTYYAACQNDASPSCYSTGDAFTFTITPLSMNANSIDATCAGPNANIDGKIILSGFTTERYDFNIGSNYTGTDTYATATAIPVGGVIVNNLFNPPTSQDYTVRVFSASGCYVDKVVTLSPTSCTCMAISPPSITGGSGPAVGTISATINTGCAAGTNLLIYSDAALTNDITNRFVISGNTASIANVGSTTTYYTRCVHNSYDCKSTTASFTLTVSVPPSATLFLSINAPTCNTNGTSNYNGRVYLWGYDPATATERWAYSKGTSGVYTGTINSYADANPLWTTDPNVLPTLVDQNVGNPVSTTIYVVRIFFPSGGYTDLTATLYRRNCTCTTFIAAPEVDSYGDATSVVCKTTDIFTHTLVKGCPAGSTLKIYTYSGFDDNVEPILGTDVTNTFTISGNTPGSTISRPYSTTYGIPVADQIEYLLICQNGSCKSSYTAIREYNGIYPNFSLTVGSGSCSGTIYNNNKYIGFPASTYDNYYVIANYFDSRIDYSLGDTYTGTANHATAPIRLNQLPKTDNGSTGYNLIKIFDNLPNPSVAQKYTLRFFSNSACYIDKVVTVNPLTCACPTMTPPVVRDTVRCGPGKFYAGITTGCASGRTLKIFSDAGLTNDITSQFTIGTVNISLSSLTPQNITAIIGDITTTTTYYTQCVLTLDPTHCKSTSDQFTVTVNGNVSGIVTGTNWSCTGTTPNSDGKITLTNYDIDTRYKYWPYSATSIPPRTAYSGAGAAVNIPTNGIIVSTLAAASIKSYLVRFVTPDGCQKDTIITLRNMCPCISTTVPSIADASRCGGAGPLNTTISTACASGSTLKIYSDAALSYDVTSSFSITASAISLANATETATYYPACLNNTYSQCNTTGVPFTFTVGKTPTATLLANDATCAGPTSNNNGVMALVGFSDEKYDYNTGSSYTGSATYATATVIPANGIIANNLPNPASSQSYTVRVFDVSGCYADKTITLNNLSCSCPAVAAPIVADANRCGTGLISATLSSSCGAGSSLKIFSDAGLSTDVTANFTVSLTSLSLANLSATATYYALCQDDVYATCRSSSDDFTLTLSPVTNATASITSTTCDGPSANSDGKITLSGFSTERYDYTAGSSYTGTATYDDANNIPVDGVIVSNLVNPLSPQDYTIRIFSGGDCYLDQVLTLNPATCSCPTVAAPAISDANRCDAGTLSATISTACVSGTNLKIYADAGLSSDVTSNFTLTANSLSSTQSSTITYYAICENATYSQCRSISDAFTLTINSLPTVIANPTDPTCSGIAANTNGKITLLGFTNEKYAYNTGNTYSGATDYSTATAIPVDGVIVNNLPNPSGSQTYTVRIFNAAGCFVDRTVTLNQVSCVCPTVPAPVIADASRCATGNISANISTACDATSSLKIFRDAALSNEVTSSFTITTTVLSLNNLSSTTNYYAVCSDNNIPSCLSSSDVFTLTVNSNPTVNANMTNATCAGSAANSNGTITLNNFSTEKYDYNAGATYTGSATYATATAIPVGGIIVDNLPNPVSNQSYIVRIFNTLGCYTDALVQQETTVCDCPLIASPVVEDASACNAANISIPISTACPSGTSMRIYTSTGLTTDMTSFFIIGVNAISLDDIVDNGTYYAACRSNTTLACKSIGESFTLTIGSMNATASATNATCTGATANSDAKITIAGFVAGQRYQYSSGSIFNSGSASPMAAIPVGGEIANNLTNTASSYTVRIYDASDDNCFVDRVVNTTVTSCACPLVPAPVVSDASRCESGLLDATLSTSCGLGSTLQIYAEAALSTDITSQFTISSSVVSKASVTATTTYYAACVSTAFPSCKSTGDAFVLTINAKPSATATATNATCSGPTINTDGKITLSGFTTEKYDYTTGSTYGGSATYATATAIPAGGVIVSNLANPSASQSYTVRIFNASGCYVDRTVTLTSTNCSCPTVLAPAISDASRCESGSVSATVSTACAAGSILTIYAESGLTTDISSQFTIGTTIDKASVISTTTYYAACVSSAFPACKSTGDAFIMTINTTPTATASATNATCSGPTVNSDGKITIAGFTTEKYDYTTGSTYSGSATYATATAIPSGGVIVSNLANPSASQSYTIRIFNASGCYVDRTVTLTSTNCSCPTVLAPAISDASRCESGSVSATVSTACAAGSILTIYAESGLTTDISSQFTIGATIDKASVTSTTTYYAACVSSAFPACKSTGDAFIMTINTTPTATASATNATCSGPAVNSDGKITLSGFTTEKYDYTTGSTYSGTATYATATAIPAGGVIVSNLANPSASQSYTVRIFNASGCYVDRTVTLTGTDCSCPTVLAPAISDASRCESGLLDASLSTACGLGSTLKIYSEAALSTDITSQFTISSSVVSKASVTATTTYYAACVSTSFPSCKSTGDAFVLTINAKPSVKGYGEPATCNGINTNNDAKIQLFDIVNGMRYGYSTGHTYSGSTYSNASVLSGSTLTISGINVMSGSSVAYTVRVFGASQDCFTDIQITIPYFSCSVSCTINAGEDQLLCQPVEFADLQDASATTEWVVGSGNPSPAVIDAVTGVISGMSSNGQYSFILRDKTDPTCMDNLFIFRGVLSLPNLTSCTSSYQLPTMPGVVWSAVSGGANVSSSGLITGMNTLGTYTFNATFNGCVSTGTVQKIDCACINPTHGTPVVTIGTCGGSTLNDDASIKIDGILGDKVGISTWGAISYDGALYTSATAINAGQVLFTGLKHGKAYIVRIYNLKEDCFKDIIVNIGTRTCCSSPNCGTVTVIKN